MALNTLFAGIAIMANCKPDVFASMNKRVAIQAVTQSSDSQGGFTETWATAKTVWASIEPANGYEKMQAMQLASPISHKVTMRYNSTVTTAHRLLFGTRVMAIKEIVNVGEENTILKLKCVEG